MAKGMKTGGRTLGTPNRATAEVKALAREFAPDVVAELARLALGAESEQARVSASRELLDRAYGRPGPHVEEDFTGRMIVSWAGDE